MRRLYCLGCQQPFAEVHPFALRWGRDFLRLLYPPTVTGTDDLPWLNLHGIDWAYMAGPKNWGNDERFH